jgi:Domain of unknown function (DUF4360)
MRRTLTGVIACGITAIAASLTAALAVPAAHAAGSTPPTEGITVDVVTVNGSGCPAGTAATAVAPDNTSFSVTYHAYAAVAGGDAKATDARKNCQLVLLVHVPQGFTYAIAQAEYHGFAHLPQGASGLERASYYFQGRPQTVRSSHPFSGPMTGAWDATDTADVATLVYAPCGEQVDFNVNTELRVKAPPSEPDAITFMAMDTTKVNVNNIFHFAWKHCD